LHVFGIFDYDSPVDNMSYVVCEPVDVRRRWLGVGQDAVKLVSYENVSYRRYMEC